jgi:hypothetical protein
VLFGFNTTLEAVEFYDPINEVWGPVAPEINSLDDIGDVTITTPADGELLAYDDGDWVNQALTSAQMPTGSILQVVQTVKDDVFSSTSASSSDVTGLTVTITPSSTASKILVTAVVLASNSDSGVSARSGGFTIFRGATNLCSPATSGSLQDSLASRSQARSEAEVIPLTMSFLDSPATTSPTTYKVSVVVDGGTIFVNRGRGPLDRYRTVSTITVMEVAG